MLFVRAYLVDQMCNIGMTIWYNWDDNDAATHKVRSNSPEPLPIYNACKNMTTELAGYHYTNRLKIGTPQDYIAVFENESGSVKIVAWTTPIKREETQDKVLVHEVTVLTKKFRGVAEVHDLYGNRAPAKAGADTITITLTASPLYISLKNK